MNGFRKKREEWILEPLIRETEVSANLAISKVLILTCYSFLLVGLLMVFGVFRGEPIVTIMTLGLAAVFGIAIFICHLTKGKPDCLKYVQIFVLIAAVFIANVISGYKVMILFSLPLILTCRYYRRYFTAITGFAIGLFIIVCSFTNAYLSPYLHIMDLNMVSFREPGTLKYYSWLHNAVISHGYDSVKILKNSLLLSAFPNCLAILLVSFGCDRFIMNAQVLLTEKHENSEIIRKALLDQKEQNEIVANAGLGIWYITLQDGKFPRMNANDKMRELLGIEDRELADEAIYTFWNDRIPESEKASVNASVAEMMEGHFSENTYKWIHPKKGEIYVRCGGTANLIGKGIYVLSGYHSDVTDVVRNELSHKQQMAQALKDAEEANKAKTTFLNNMSHDIRTPMNAILGFSDLMESHIDDPATLAEYLKKIKTSGEYLLTIINNVLEMAKIESGSIHFDKSLYDFTEENIVKDIFKAELSKKNLDFQETRDIKHERIFTDVAKCHQIFVNLLSNAIKYTPDGGTITYDTKEIPCDREGYATYVSTLTDTGIGMSKEFLEHIFDDFSREHNTTDSKINGTGLGMAIVKKLVDFLGGTIEIESELGKGTKITLSITHQIAEAEVEYIDKNVDSLCSCPTLEGKRILLAEDNDLNAEIAVSLLEEVGLVMDRAVDGVECVKMLSKAADGYYDAILMDIQMPNMNGYEATRTIRAMEGAKAGIPIIAMTANAFSEDRKSALDSGMDGFVSKPIDFGVLVSELSKHLR